MRKATLLYIFSIFILAAIILSILILYAEKPNSKKNGFLRKMTTSLTLSKSISHNSTIQKICGISDSLIFFSGKNPRNILYCKFEFSKLDSLYVPFLLSESVLSNCHLTVLYPDVLLYAGNRSTIQYSHVTNRKINLLKVSPPLFTQAISLSSGNHVLKAFDSTGQFQTFQKIDKLTGRKLAERNIFGVQHDGGFSFDGLLNYDNVTQNIIFVQYYQNTFFCLDTNLVLKFKGRTIDTTFSNPVTTHSFIESGKNGSLMPAVPLQRVNERSCVLNGKLYILSNLRADNDALETFENNSVIDIYNLTDGNYEKSLYLPLQDNKKTIDFRVTDNKIIALNRNNILVFNYQ